MVVVVVSWSRHEKSLGVSRVINIITPKERERETATAVAALIIKKQKFVIRFLCVVCVCVRVRVGEEMIWFLVELGH